MIVIRKFRSSLKGPTPAAVALAAILCAAAPQAKASTYLFSFTATDVLSALHTSEGDAFNASAYFAIFVQPSAAAVSSYSYLNMFTGPNTGAPDAWQVNTITDPSNANLGYKPAPDQCTTNCTWVQFSKQDVQSSVMVLSQADPANGSNGDIFLHAAYHDNVPAPYGWGATNATITSVINGTNANPVFQFSISTPLTLAGPVTLSGYASELRSGSTGTFTTSFRNPTKEHDGIQFSLTATPVATPEPGSSLTAAGGLSLLAALLVLKKHKWPFRKEWRESIAD
jgi:hypothetical protein